MSFVSYHKDLDPLPAFNAPGTVIPIVFDPKPDVHTSMLLPMGCRRCVIMAREGALGVHILKRQEHKV